MKTKFLANEFTYDGQQLRSLYGYLDHGLLGDSVIAWIGPCAIPFEHMVDGEDLREQAKIEGSKMVHFIMELFESSLFAGVNAQRLMASIVMDYLKETSPNEEFASSLRREGDDIFFGDKKLSISIATVSPVSTLIHFAVNVSNLGTPVPTLSLEDLQVDAKLFATEILELMEKEMNSIRDATKKVRWVK